MTVKLLIELGVRSTTGKNRWCSDVQVDWTQGCISAVGPINTVPVPNRCMNLKPFQGVYGRVAVMDMAVIVIHAVVRVTLMAMVIMKVAWLVWHMAEVAIGLAFTVCRHCMCMAWDLSVAVGMSATRRFLSGRS